MSRRTRSFRHGVGRAVGVVGIMAPALGCVASPASPGTWDVLEARLTRLAPAARDAAIARFVDGRGGTPIVEGEARLRFLVRSTADRPPRIVGDFNAWAAGTDGVDMTVGTMTRVDGTSWWTLEARADPDARVEYMIFGADGVFADPLNPRSVGAYTGPRSEVRMPAWVIQPELDRAEPVPTGRLIPERFESHALGGSRRVWFYLPPGYDASPDLRFPSVYLLDGGSFVERMDAPAVLDRLIALGAIDPVVAVFVDPVDRVEEYQTSDAWPVFMTSEVVPVVDARFRTTGAQGRVVLGTSFGAVGAVRLGCEAPGSFHLVAAIAPPAAAVACLEALGDARPHPAGRWFVLGGRFDHLLADARRLALVLRQRGESVIALEVPEGHSTETFRGHLDDAVTALLARDAGR